MTEEREYKCSNCKGTADTRYVNPNHNIRTCPEPGGQGYSYETHDDLMEIIND